MFYSKKLKKFQNIKHCFFSRQGGFSKGIYSGLNCGKGSKDKKKNIHKNLSYVSKKMKITSDSLLLMQQTHSNKVIIITKKNKDLKKFNSDALITKLKGISLGVVTADCVPIILYDINNQIIGCIFNVNIYKNRILGCVFYKKILENCILRVIFIKMFLKIAFWIFLT